MGRLRASTSSSKQVPTGKMTLSGFRRRHRGRSAGDRYTFAVDGGHKACVQLLKQEDAVAADAVKSSLQGDLDEEKATPDEKEERSVGNECGVHGECGSGSGSELKQQDSMGVQTHTLCLLSVQC